MISLLTCYQDLNYLPFIQILHIQVYCKVQVLRTYFLYMQMMMNMTGLLKHVEKVGMNMSDIRNQRLNCLILYLMTSNICVQFHQSCIVNIFLFTSIPYCINSWENTNVILFCFFGLSTNLLSWRFIWALLNIWPPYVFSLICPCIS